MNTEKVTVDGRPALRFERTLAHPPERVWRAVSEPAELERWFIAAAPWMPAEGETFAAYGESGTVREVDPPRRLAWDFGSESYSFDLEPSGDGTRLVFHHFFDEARGPGGQHAGGWEAVFLRLDPWLAGEELPWGAAQERLGEWNERYAIAFGESAAPAREAVARHAELPLRAEGGTLRLERSFGYPIDRVWRALVDERAHWFPADAPFEVTRSEPPHLLEGRFWGTPLRFELTAQAEGCRLRFTHDFGAAEDSAMAAAGWDRCIVRLDALLAGRPISEGESLELWPVVHERYAEAFGVDPERGRAMFSAHPST